MRLPELPPVRLPERGALLPDDPVDGLDADDVADDFAGDDADDEDGAESLAAADEDEDDDASLAGAASLGLSACSGAVVGSLSVGASVAATASSLPWIWFKAPFNLSLMPMMLSLASASFWSESSFPLASC